MKGFKQRSVDVHQFAMVPRADIPRAAFRMQKGLKTSFDAGYLVPVLCEEVLPGDQFHCRMTAFARLATPIFPYMDNLHLESFFFFVPNRLVWSNWVRFMGQQNTPSSSIDFTIPETTSPVGGYDLLSVQDYFGLPTVGQVEAASTVTHSCLPLRGYNLIYNSWFRDENLISQVTQDVSNGPDLSTSFELLRRGKRHDYFTSCLPWPQKGGVAVTLPLGTSAPVLAGAPQISAGAATPMVWADAATGLPVVGGPLAVGAAATGQAMLTATAVGVGTGLLPQNLYADLSAATSATINQLRESFQIQKLLERDARGGTRYTELVRAHFGVVSPDARLQRPEYLGGGRTAINVNPIPQTSATDATTPQGNLAAMATTLASGHGFSQSFTEHGYVIGLVNVFADLTYQQGLRRHWSRSTRYDFYFPAFATLGEQAVLSKEIYCTGETEDDDVFGYQERWAEYRYTPSEITGLMRSTAATPIDAWHLAQVFTARPTLNSTFINENPPIDRVVAVGEDADGQQLIMDAFFDIKAVRPMPLYSVPGLIDHF